MAAALETTWRASSPESIEADLAALWREAGRAGPVSRCLMSNLVVVSPVREFRAIEDLARRHPARTLLLSYAPAVEPVSAPAAVRVGLHTFGDERVRYGLEFVAVHTTCADEALASIVRGLTIGSLPTSIWWTGSLGPPQLPAAITGVGRQLVYSSADWTDVESGFRALASLVDREQGPELSDLNWRRIEPLRAALVHAVRSAQPAGTSCRVTGARVAHASGEAAAAWLAAGWLEARLGVHPEVVESEREEVLTVALTLDTGETISAAMSPSHVRVTNERPPFTVQVPGETEADAVAAELLALTPDRGLRDALRALDRRFG